MGIDLIKFRAEMTAVRNGLPWIARPSLSSMPPSDLDAATQHFGLAIRFLLVYIDSSHRGEVDYAAAIAHSEPEPAVASGTHRQWQILGLGKIKRARDIRRATAAYDHSGTPINWVGIVP